MLTLLVIEAYGLVFGAACLLGVGGYLGYILARERVENNHSDGQADPSHLQVQAELKARTHDAEQQRRFNELAIRKLELELASLRSQIKVHAEDQQRVGAARDFHELSVEKTKLEIDSLRLHIAEQRKRMDDWGLGGGG